MSHPSPRLTLYPGAVTTASGRYRVVHSTGHHPPTEVSLDKGWQLPPCGVVGCLVTFEYLDPARDHLSEPTHVPAGSTRRHGI